MRMCAITNITMLIIIIIIYTNNTNIFITTDIQNYIQIHKCDKGCTLKIQTQSKEVKYTKY